MKRLSYREGTWFAVPLKDGGYAAGVVARVGRRGVLFGYFFGPRRPAAPSLSDLEGLTPNNAVLAIVGDIDPKVTLEKVRKAFEPIPAQPAPPCCRS